jgi:C-terminal processing protease CtpA/Prc
VLTVASVRKDGPAAGSGLVAGDVIVAVDGHDVRGEQSWQFRPRTQVPEGTVIHLALLRGESVEIRAGPP